MEIVLIVIVVVLIFLTAYLLLHVKKMKQQRKLELTKKEMQFLEFTVDMYIKYAQDLNIHSPTEHEFIVKELERIRQEKLLPQINDERTGT